jgi:sec-independent protein translocase protein TatA
MPFNLGPTEMIFILVVLLVLFGAKRLPELGSGLGKGIREFKRSMREINTEVERPDDNQIHSGQHRPVGPGATADQRTASTPTETREQSGTQGSQS